MYVVDRDFGFAPNPFHGICSLATCKPRIRNKAQVEDWVLGMGGKRLDATGRCIFAMKITQKVTFNEYWNTPDFRDKKPVRNGSKKMLLGDNIYSYNEITGLWTQAHSHHSFADGSPNVDNLERDTQSTNVLLSRHFYYFGSAAPFVPQRILDGLGFKNQMGHRVFNFDEGRSIIQWIESQYGDSLNLVLADPFDFDQSEAHYSVKTNRVTVK